MATKQLHTILAYFGSLVVIGIDAYNMKPICLWNMASALV